jgi:hypothetical protein
MDDNLYDSPEAEQPTTPEQESPEGSEEHGEGATALINKEACPDANPGDEVTFRVLRVMDNELEVERVDDKGEEKKPEMAESSMMAGGGEDSLMM